MDRRPHALRATVWGLVFTFVLGVLIIVGSRNLAHFDAALVGYTFATLFATFGITYRYAMWLQRPPTRMYWRRGWRVFLDPRNLVRNLGQLVKRAVVDFPMPSEPVRPRMNMPSAIAQSWRQFTS